MMTTKAFLIYLIVNILNTYIVSIFLKAFLGEHIKNKYIYRFHLLLYNPTQILIYIFDLNCDIVKVEETCGRRCSYETDIYDYGTDKQA